MAQRGDDATGWSLAWKINFWARLEDGNHAYTLIKTLLTPAKTYNNLFDAHPPFQIDGNFGAVSGVNEMLLQSQNNEIQFLPALPSVWPTGYITGIRARNGFIVDSLFWSGSKLGGVTLTSHLGETLNVRYGAVTKSYPTVAGMTYKLDAQLNLATVNGPAVNITAPLVADVFEAPASITISANATDADGSVANVEFYNGTVKLGEDATAQYSYLWTNVAAGTYSITAVATDNSGNKTTSAPLSVKVAVPQTAYIQIPATIPGIIQFEEFDNGGNGSAYYDASADNTGGASFRTDDEVDIENCTDAGAGFDVGLATAGEWMEYTVNVAAAGKYDLTLRVACNLDGRTVSLSSGSSVLAKDIAIPNTAGWQTWEKVTVPNISLSAGTQVIRVTIGANDYVNLNYMKFSALTPPSESLVAGWNFVGCPLSGSTDIDKALASIWANVLTVKSADAFYDKSQTSYFNLLKSLDWGQGYAVKVSKDCVLDWNIK